MKDDDRNIYLHFFDRELRDSVSCTLTDAEAERILLTALFMSNLTPYASFSNMYECIAAFPAAVKTAFECEKFGLIEMLTNLRSADEFLASRRRLYQFDRERYPYYFTSDDPLWPVRTAFIPGADTASILKSKMPGEILASSNLSRTTKQSFFGYLDSHDNNALTFNAFKGLIQSGYNKLEIPDDKYVKGLQDIRNIVSLQYSSRYIDVHAGTIVTGIRGLSFYDHLAGNPFVTNIKLYSLILGPLFEITKKSRYELIQIRTRNESKEIIYVIQRIILCLQQITEGKVDAAAAILRRYINPSFTVSNYQEFMSYCLFLYDCIVKRAHELGVNIKMETRILLIVATPLEYEITYKKLQELGSVTPSFGIPTYLYSNIGSNSVYVVKCQMGQGGSGGAILTLKDAIKVISPDYVIMCGVAWGANKKEQKIGDLIISSRIWDYDPEKLTSDGTAISRGSISPSSPYLYQMFETEDLVRKDKNYKLHFGLIASGSKLLNNRDAVEELKKQEPEIIGGDMESAGMCSVCERESINYIMVKGICDWGYNKDKRKNDYQRIAANNAVDVVLSVSAKLCSG